MPSLRKVGVPGKRGLPHDFVPYRGQGSGQWVFPPGPGMMYDEREEEEEEEDSSSGEGQMLA